MAKNFDYEYSVHLILWVSLYFLFSFSVIPSKLSPDSVLNILLKEGRRQPSESLHTKNVVIDNNINIICGSYCVAMFAVKALHEIIY